MKAYGILVLSVIGFYAVFTGRAKALLCAVTLGNDAALKCDDLFKLPLTRQVTKGTYYPANYGND